MSAVKKYGSAFGMRTLRRIVPLASRRTSASARAQLGSTPDRPRVTLAMTGKNDRTAAIIILDSGLSEPEPGVEQRRERDDRDRAGGDGERQQHARACPPSGRPANATTTPAVTPMMNPPTASKSVDWADCAQREPLAVPVVDEGGQIADGAGRMNALSCRPRTIASQSDEPGDRDHDGRQVLARPARAEPRGGARRRRPAGRLRPTPGRGAHPTAPSARVRRDGRPRPRRRRPGRPRGAPRGPR